MAISAVGIFILRENESLTRLFQEKVDRSDIVVSLKHNLILFRIDHKQMIK